MDTRPLVYLQALAALALVTAITADAHGEPACAAGAWQPCHYCLPAPLSLDRGVGRQACDAGEWQMECQEVQRQEVELPGDDPRFFHEYGFAVSHEYGFAVSHEYGAAHSWVTPAMMPAGWYAQYGPRSSLPPGRYRVEFRGQAPLPAAGGARTRLDFDVRNATGGRVLAQSLGMVAAGAFTHTLVFDSPASCHELEFRVRFRGGVSSGLTLRSTRLVPLPPADAPLAVRR